MGGLLIMTIAKWKDKMSKKKSPNIFKSYLSRYMKKRELLIEFSPALLSISNKGAIVNEKNYF